MCLLGGQVNLSHEEARTATAWEPHCFFPYTMHDDSVCPASLCPGYLLSDGRPFVIY